MHLLHNYGLHPLAIFAFATEVFALAAQANATVVRDGSAEHQLLLDAELCLAHDAETFFEDRCPCTVFSSNPCACCQG